MVFGKKGIDVYDYTLLQRKGLVEKPKEKEVEQANVDAQGYFDFSATQGTPTQTPEVSAQPQSEVSNPLSFFDTFAQQSSQAPQLTEGLPEPPKHDPTDLMDLKVKLEDFEYKLEKLTDKIVLLEARLDEFGNNGL